jgi:argininosuccinate lyase
MTLWQGRFEGGTADAVMAFSTSLAYDRLLALDDLAGSRAHVRGLGRGGLLDPGEVSELVAALDQVAVEFDAGTFVFAPDDEDIHTAIERRVTEIAGDVGAKLHTGRSRNDQVATDLRLYAKRELRAVATEVVALQEVLLTRANQAEAAYLPGYTHLQRAQPWASRWWASSTGS